MGTGNWQKNDVSRGRGFTKVALRRLSGVGLGFRAEYRAQRVQPGSAFT